MASVIVVITGCEIKKGKGKYFAMCQLDQHSNSETDINADKVTMKKKTDVSEGTQFPQFSINTLIFEDVIIFSSVTLKIGVFEITEGEVKKTRIIVCTSRVFQP